jgi:hypothetical protein
VMGGMKGFLAGDVHGTKGLKSIVHPSFP